MEIGCGGLGFLVGWVVAVRVALGMGAVEVAGPGLLEVATGPRGCGADAGLVQPPNPRASPTTNAEQRLICRVFPDRAY